MKMRNTGLKVTVFYASIYLVLFLFVGFAQAETKPEWQLKWHNDVPTTTRWHKYGCFETSRAIEKATQGRVKITIYPNQTLIPAEEMLSGIKSGLVDIGVAMTFSYFGRMPLTDIVHLPFLGIQSGSIGSRIILDLYHKFPEIQAEYAGYKVLSLATLDPYFLLSNKPIHVIEDFKGLKIRVPGGTPTNAMKALGAVPMQVEFADLYLAMDRGVIDACAAGWALTDDADLYGTAKYYNDKIKFWTYPLFIVMNLNLWNSFPPDIQKAIEKVTGYAAAERYGGDAFDGIGDEGHKKLSKEGGKFTEISDSELSKIRQVVGEPIWKQWVSDMQRKGLPGKEVLDETLRLIKKYQ